jgi:hypothetical protein
MSSAMGTTSSENQEIIARFESGAIAGDAFHHADHVRLAFAYLSECRAECGAECGVLEALDKFTSALKKFAAANGKPQLYHETITYAYFFLIRERMVRCAGTNWEEFACQNPDLLVWKNGILSRYYSEATLKSDLARKVFVFPDACR